MLTREELKQLPPRYRWLLKLIVKLPNPSIPYSILRKLPEIEGILWALLVPILLMVYFYFSVWFVTFLSLHVVFPLNIVLGLLIPGTLFVFFLRIQLERTILLWRNLQGSNRQWDVSKAVEEFAELLRKQKQQQIQQGKKQVQS